MRALVLVVALLICGCTTSAQRQHKQINTTISETFKELNECRAGVVQTDSAKALIPHLWLSSGEPPLSYSTNDTYPMDAELAFIDKLAQESLSCDKISRERLASAHPDFPLIIGDYISAKRSLYLALLRREITYGAFHAKMMELRDLLERTWSQTAQQIVSQLNQNHYAELQHRRAALLAFGQAMTAQSAAIAASQPHVVHHHHHQPIQRRTITTNCYAVGAGVQCTTW